MLILACSNIMFMYSQDIATNGNSTYAETLIKKTNTFNQTVFVCTGPYAYAYHSKSDCPGLSNCSGEIKYTDEISAINSRWSKPCCRCWSNVVNNCKDDNPTYVYRGGSGSSGSGDQASGIAIAIIAGSAIILSNDMYLYRLSTFDRHQSNGTYYSESGYGTGWSFGFRKTFKKSALEYGMSIIDYKIKYKNINDTYRYGNSEKYGIYFNYIHEIFASKMPNKVSLYVGPTINSFEGTGYGAIIGTYYKLFDRLKIDFRYERTTQTNQIQLGLIFNYQKKYFWQ